LYYAASTYVNANDYDVALKLYDDLKTLNYSEKGTSYFAVNKLTTQEDFFNTLQERDRMVKLGTHESLEQKQFLQKEVRFIKYRFDFNKRKNGRGEESSF
jgi:hypothetical protein